MVLFKYSLLIFCLLDALIIDKRYCEFSECNSGFVHFSLQFYWFSPHIF